MRLAAQKVLARSQRKSLKMFSDFENHNIAVPKLAPALERKTGNVIFDGPEANQDFGAGQISADPSDRYKFRTSTLRNVALQPTLFHEGPFTKLEDAIRHHLDVITSVHSYDPKRAGVNADLRKLSPVTEPQQQLCKIIPERLPSGRKLQEFKECN